MQLASEAFGKSNIDREIDYSDKLSASISLVCIIVISDVETPLRTTGQTPDLRLSSSSASGWQLPRSKRLATGEPVKKLTDEVARRPVAFTDR